MRIEELNWRFLICKKVLSHKGAKGTKGKLLRIFKRKAFLFANIMSFAFAKRHF